MKATPLKYAQYKSQIVELKGGVNENVSSLELKAGELIDCKNYMIAEGGYGGYLSLGGFERFSGKGLPSEYVSYVFTLINCSNAIVSGNTVTDGTATTIALGDGVVTSGSYTGGDATVVVQLRDKTGTFTVPSALNVSGTPVGTLSAQVELTGGNSDYHLGIEYFRTGIEEVPGEGPILGVHIYKAKVYAWRKTVSAATVNFCVEDSSTGWSTIDTSATWISGMHVHGINANYSARVEGYCMYWTDTANEAREYDGTTVVICDNSANVPTLKPINLVSFNDYLILVYEGGSIFYSNIGAPTDWSVAGGGGGNLAGEIGVGGEVTNLTIGVKSTLIINMDYGIKIISGRTPATWQMDTFSYDAGAFKHTAQRLLGTIMFVGEQGLTSMEAVQEFGDYAANSLTQKVKKTLNAKKNQIANTVASKTYNQYRVYFEDHTGIVVSFQGKEFLGATFIEYNKKVDRVASGEDASYNELTVFSDGDDNGYIYKMDSGTSFDGVSIVTRMATAYYHYGSPRAYKSFKRATVEFSGENSQVLNLKVSFDYNEPDTPTTIWYTPQVYTQEGSAVWGETKWGTMVYGAVISATARVPIYIQGIGTNMSYKIITNEAYRKQHIIQNIITDYSAIGRRI